MTATVSPPTKGSLCSGYGGLDLATPGALHFTAETDADAAALLAREHPLVPNLGDITTRRWSHRDHVELLTAGFPCTPVSAAGRQKVQNDVRWLWPAVLDAIVRSRPDEVFLENVQNLVSIQHGAILAEILMGLRDARYECRWTVLGACAVGAPHHRHRWFLRGRRVRGRVPEAVRLINQCGAPRSGGRVLLPTPTTADGMGGPGKAGRDGGLNLRTAVMLLPTPMARDADGRAAMALLPTPRATDVGTPGRRSSEGWRPQLGQAVALLPTPRASDGERGRGNCSQTFGTGSLTLGAAATPERWGKFARAVALWEPIIGRPAPEPTEPAPKGGRRLNPALSEWMMGLPPGLVTSGTTRSAALRLAGNGVVPAAVAAAYAMLGWATP